MQVPAAATGRPTWRGQRGQRHARRGWHRVSGLAYQGTPTGRRADVATARDGPKRL